MPKGIRNVPLPWTCRDCGLDGWHRNPGKPPPRCAECLSKFYRERSAAARAADDGEANREYQFNHRMRLYGLDPDLMRARREAHDGLCESCGAPGDYVDHCHATKTFRGFLCPGCNKALGLLGDSIPRILALAAYLGRHQ